MTWEDELEADFIETDPDDIYGFFKSRITSLLEKQVRGCAKLYKILAKDINLSTDQIYIRLLDTPEP